MDNETLLAGRIKDLARKAYENNYVTHTDFLSMSELYEVNSICIKNKMITGQNMIEGVQYVPYGGVSDPDRAVLCFLPSYLDEETFLLQEKEESDVISCILIEPVNKKFADELSHRDFLGSIMNLGIERNRIGDIRTDSLKGYVFVTNDVADIVLNELCRIRHTTVKCKKIKVTECDIVPEFETLEGTVPSERLDAILALVYKLSRSKAQELIENQSVYVDGKTAYSGGYDLSEGSRVSVRGYGKFIYDGMAKATRKGRLLVTIRRFV
ncbi:MAG: RNA-binding protein [Butyrivibrio sp.]|uniref:YlmH/Sll1252 family protein n=1 Tax=Butyrivibrio sp. NC2002 TaxID=1410610 RepID=UPI00068D244C|nr:YlmH/Sll1252 family protein [Butyrivibrio sp. NC2002]MBE5860589.1 RNA-binding protein [Butyrivibrio sp.]